MYTNDIIAVIIVIFTTAIVTITIWSNIIDLITDETVICWVETPCPVYSFYRISDKYFKRHVGDVYLPFELFQFFAGLNVWVSWNASRRISRWLMFLKITLSLIRSPNVSASSWKCPFRSSSLPTLSLKLGGRNVGNFNGDQNLPTRPPIVRQAFTLFWYQLPPPLL